jgi:hypothetical protein
LVVWHKSCRNSVDKIQKVARARKSNEQPWSPIKTRHLSSEATSSSEITKQQKELCCDTIETNKELRRAATLGKTTK